MSFDQSIEEALAINGVEVTPDMCEKVGEALPDIAGIGVMVSFAGQAALSLLITIWVFFLSRKGHLNLEYEEGSIAHRKQKKKLELFSSMLMVGNDIQMLLGIAYMITIWVKQNKIGVYHLRLAFDTVSFVGISGIAAFVWTRFVQTTLNKPSHRLGFQYLTIAIYAAFFFALTIVTITHLLQWNEHSEALGFCYNIDNSADEGSDQPGTEITYVVITGFTLLITMILAIFSGPRFRIALVAMALLHYGVHLYFMVVVRHANQKLLEGVEREDRWDFGQSTAMMLLGFSIYEVLKKSFSVHRLDKIPDEVWLEEGATGLESKLEADD